MTLTETPIRGVLLDVDGTLVDTNAFHAEAWRLAFEEMVFIFQKRKFNFILGWGEIIFFLS